MKVTVVVNVGKKGQVNIHAKVAVVVNVEKLARLTCMRKSLS